MLHAAAMLYHSAVMPPELRPIQKAAKEWQMEAHMWMFAEANDDVKADVQMMMELRTEMCATAKDVEKVLAVVTSKSSMFSMIDCGQLGKSCAYAKDCRTQPR